jgi:hypothetical protein
LVFMSAPAASAGLKAISCVSVLKFSQNAMICRPPGQHTRGCHVSARQLSMLRLLTPLKRCNRG